MPQNMYLYMHTHAMAEWKVDCSLPVLEWQLLANEQD